MSEVVVRAREVSRHFGARRAVDGVSLEVERGEVFGFLGPNGAGKSTLLRMLIGLLTPTAGQIETLGRQLPRESEGLRQRIGFMPQRFSLYEDLSVAENLAFAADIHGLGADARARRLAQLFAELDLEGFREQRAGALSGGTKQRLALAAATVHHPELLLLDEPTAGVDPQQRRMFWERIFDLAAEGVTTLVSTHSMDEAVRCHRLVMIRRGKVVALGTPGELRRALAGRVVEVSCDPPEKGSRLLVAQPAVASVTHLGELLHVLLAPASGPAGEVAQRLQGALRAAGLAGATAREIPPSLEDVFVAANLEPSMASAMPEVSR